MPAITPPDLNQGKQNIDFIDAFATSTAPTATDRLGRARTTVEGYGLQMVVKVVETEAKRAEAFDQITGIVASTQPQIQAVLDELNVDAAGTAIGIDRAAAEAAAVAAAIVAAPRYTGDVEGSIVVPIFPDELFAGGTAIFNDSLQVVLGIDAQAGLVGNLGARPEMAVVFPDEGWTAVFLAGDGVSVLSGVDKAGIPYPPTPVTLPSMDWHAFADSAGGVSLDSDSGVVVRLAAGNGTVRSPASLAGKVSWVDEASGSVEVRRFLMDIGSNLPVTVARVLLIPMLGQSLSAGSNGTPIQTPSPTWAGRSWMLNGGARPLQGSTFEQPTDLVLLKDAQAMSLVEHFEALAPGSTYYGETHGGGISWWLGAPGRMAADTVMVFATLGVGGANVDQLQGAPLTNLVRLAERIKAMCALRGLALEIPCVPYDQGESNFSTAAATYMPKLRTLQASLTTRLNAVTGGAGEVPMLIMQPSSWTHYGYSTADIVPAMLAECIAQPTKFKLSGAQYWISNYATDGVHMLGAGYRKCGELEGRAIAAIRAGGATPAVYATAAAAVGTALTITFATGSQLALDTTLVSNPGQYGLRVFNGSGTEVALSSIAISGANQVTATLATALSGSWSLGIADKGTPGTTNVGPIAGPRACIRDSATDLRSDAGPLYNWAAHQVLSITV